MMLEKLRLHVRAGSFQIYLKQKSAFEAGKTETIPHIDGT